MALKRSNSLSSPVSDCLRPSKRDSSKALAKSRQTWGATLSSSRKAIGWPIECGTLDSLLNGTPAIPTYSSGIEERSAGPMLCVDGHARWEISSSKGCELDSSYKKAGREIAIIGGTRPNFCTISDDLLPDWKGFEGFSRQNHSNGNHLALLTLGWSYVLSACLVELRKKSDDDRISYTEKAATGLSRNEQVPGGARKIHLRDANAQECRWWAALLAQGCGWDAILRQDSEEYRPSMACHLHAEEPPFVIECAGVLSREESSQPPSASLALRYLCDYATRHNVYDQLVAAFAGALTLPNHLRFGTPVTLPPVPCEDEISTSSNVCSTLRVPSIDQLPHFLALVCLPKSIPSCLFSAFWDPGVDCNLVSEWLSPVSQDILPSLLQDHDYETLVRIMAARRPNTAPLWLGAIITGFAPKIASLMGDATSMLCLEAAYWTRSSQSFMDPQFVEHARRGTISRREEIRLAYMCDLESERYGMPPQTPFPPFGSVSLRDTVLDVQLHASCKHQMEYGGWVWEGRDGHTLDDFGINPSQVESRSYLHPGTGAQMRTWLSHFQRRFLTRLCQFSSAQYQTLEEAGFDDSLSEKSTKDAFIWAFWQDGIKACDQPLFNHEWLNFLLELSDEEESQAPPESPCSPSA